MGIVSFFLLFSSLSFAEQAPKFQKKDLFGQMQSIEKYKGQYLVLYFWATWCPACVQEVNNMKKTYKKLKSKSVGLVTVSLDKNRQQLENFVRKRGIEYPVLFSGQGWNDPIVSDYQVDATPGFFLISPQSEVVARGSWSEEIFDLLKKVSK